MSFFHKWLLRGKAAESYMTANETRPATKGKFDLIEAKMPRRTRLAGRNGLPLNLTYWDDTKSSMRRDAAPARASI
jgi:hypothetical protein